MKIVNIWAGNPPTRHISEGVRVQVEVAYNLLDWPINSIDCRVSISNSKGMQTCQPFIVSSRIYRFSGSKRKTITVIPADSKLISVGDAVTVSCGDTHPASVAIVPDSSGS